MSRSKKECLKAGHYEVLGETYAQFEFFDERWNPYRRFLDVEKVDFILRRKIGSKIVYREVQVKYGKLHECKSEWEKNHFGVTSLKFFKEDEFEEFSQRDDFFVCFILKEDNERYKGDVLIFPIKDFNQLLKQAILCKTKKGYQRKIYFSRSKNDSEKWYLRKIGIKFEELKEGVNVVDVSKYYKNFKCLEVE